MFKTQVKKRIDRIKQVRLLHILYHTHPADLGIVLQMKHRHKFLGGGGERERRRRMRGSKEEENEGCEGGEGEEREDMGGGERGDGILDKR